MTSARRDRAARHAIALFAFVVSGCPSQIDLGVDAGQPAPDAGHNADVVPATTLPPTRALGGPFATSLVCAECHSESPTSTAMRDVSGATVAPFDLWEATLMANAARDPIYLAQIAAEVQHAPPAAEAIETTCLSCHSPLLYRQRDAAGAPVIRMFELFSDSDDGARALDGVSCAACHRIAAEGLGSPTTFDGKFRLGPDDVIYGPYPNPLTGPMEEETGFTPTEGAHQRDSALCGSCHTLATHALRPDGSETGVIFDEQVTFLEWRATGSTTITCQSCHMPTRDSRGGVINTAIARAPDGTDFPNLTNRSPYARHIFVGGNSLALALLRDEPLLGATAPPEAFNALIGEVDALLARAAQVSIGTPRVEAQRVTIPVTARALTGHKLPTGYPSRRVVLHVRVLDQNNNVILESGRIDAQGRVVDSTGAPLPGEGFDGVVHPHVDVVDSDAVVQVWEEVPGDEDGLPTATLLKSNVFLKDNRLLPQSFNATSPDGQRVAPIGIGDDTDFSDNGDVVDIVVPNDVARVPRRIEVRLLYQTLAPRWRDGLAATGTPWAIALEEMLDRADLTPAVLAEAQAPL